VRRRQLAATYDFGISRNRPFRDGDNRARLVIAELFPNLTGLQVTACDAECVTTFLDLAAGDLTEEQLADWITEHSVP
jgi:death-on-curing protein